MKTFLYTLLVMLISISAQAQHYDFVSFNRTYFESDNWTSITNGEVWDDPSYEFQLPFDFDFYGESINSIYLIEDGYGAILGTQPLIEDNSLSLIVPFDIDIIDRGYNDNQSLSEIRYTTEVTDDNELFIIEWQNVGFYSEIYDGAESVSYISFQVIFNRNFNAIEFSYGESNIVNPNFIYNDYEGPSVCLIQNLDDNPTNIGEAFCLVGDANIPSTQLTEANDGEGAHLIGDIPANKSYLFSVNDAVSTIDYLNRAEVKLHPSPASDALRIDSDIAFVNYSILTFQGVFVKQSKLDLKQIDISSLNSGLYLLVLTDVDGQRINKPFLKE